MQYTKKVCNVRLATPNCAYFLNKKLPLPSDHDSSFHFPSRKIPLSLGIVIFHGLLIYAFMTSRTSNSFIEANFSTELFIVTKTVAPLEIEASPSNKTPKFKVTRNKPLQLPLTNITKAANEMRITAMDFDQMIAQQKQQSQANSPLKIDHGQLAKELERKPERTLHFPSKAPETALEKLKKGYERAAPYVEYETKSYINPDGSRMTKVISNKGVSCVRTNRPHDRLDNRGPRLWSIEC
jgi:hypothetical protein